MINILKTAAQSEMQFADPPANYMTNVAEFKKSVKTVTELQSRPTSCAKHGLCIRDPQTDITQPITDFLPRIRF